MNYEINAMPVGGYVRDTLMSLEPKDIDYVVLGSTPKEMIAQGFKQVGADFPVFLHPGTGDEYALARTERKVAAGYQGFVTDHSPTVMLYDDLKRRDLTINAMAFSNEGDGFKVIDYFGGQEDIKNKILRHTSEAFKEDPVRILRVARFAARYNFDVHHTTEKLMSEMVTNGEFDSLVAERVWAEFEKGLMEKYFWQIWCVLEDCGALEHLPLYNQADYSSFEAAADAGEPLLIRCAAMFSLFSQTVFTNNRIPSDIAELALLTDKFEIFANYVHDKTITRQMALRFYESVDLFRRPERFALALKVLKYRDVKFPIAVEYMVQHAMSVNAGEIALTCSDPLRIKEAIALARIVAMGGINV
jgi:tRNA nucleotidyltransferase (CCA-adding enzyme)